MRRFLAAVLLCLAVPGLPARAASAPSAAPLFEVDTGAMRSRSPAGAGRVTSTALRLQPGAGAALARGAVGDRWSIPVEATESVTVVVETVEGDGLDGIRFTGRVEGVPGSAVQGAMSDDQGAITIRRPGLDMVRILPVGATRHEVERCSEASAPRCGNPTIAAEDARRAEAIFHKALSGVAPLQTNIIDVAFLYTRAAAEAGGGESGIRALVNLALLEANDAYERSAARVRLRPVCLVSVGYEESGDLVLDLDRLARAGDGWLDEVAEIRDTHGADVVCLVTEFENTNQYAGMANQLRDTTSAALARGFTACLRPYLIGNYTLPHEVGHILGCNHDRENAGGGGLEAWSHGTRITVDGAVYRTVMAYRPGLQFPHFSNPLVRYRGVATGVATGAAAADNVRTLNATAGLVAAVREPAARVGFSSALLEVDESAGVVRVPWALSGAMAGVSFTVRTVEASARAGIDFDTVDRRVVLDGGEGDGAGVELSLRDNLLHDGPRRFTVALTDPSSGLAVGPNAVLTVTVRDDEVDGAAVLDTGVPVRTGADYLVTSLVRSGDGVVVGGGFATFDGASRPRVARLQADGTLDEGYRIDVKYRVDALAALPEGRLAMAGEFNTVNGQRLNHVAVVGADGTLDARFAFDPGAESTVLAVRGLADGGLLIGGLFTNVQGRVRMRVARLTAAGAVDPGFDPGLGPDAEVRALVMTAEEWGTTNSPVVIGGRFRNVDGVARGGVARLTSVGLLDEGFAGGPGADAAVHALAMDEQGRFLVAGEFRFFDGRVAGGVARLTSDGRVDEGFATGLGSGADGAVRAVARATTGGWWIAGGFQKVDGTARRHVARLREDGTLDPDFDPGIGPDDWVTSVTDDRAGSVWIGGLFRRVNGVPRGGVAALLTAAPGAARFVSATVDPDGFAWRAQGAAGQWYVLEGADELGLWRGEGALRATAGVLEGRRSTAGRAATFLRLRRQLQ